MDSTVTNYYIVQTEEDKEFAVQKKIKSIYPEFDVVIPTEENVMSIQGRKFLYNSRMMPDYLFVGAKVLDPTAFEQISKIKDVIQIMSEVSGAKRIPSRLEKDEVNRFIARPNKKAVEFIETMRGFGSTVNIIYGQYAGYSASIKSVTDDNDIIVTVNISAKPKIKLPVWHIGYELKQEKVGV